MPSEDIPQTNGAVVAHNDTTGKQGGITGEYYHLTELQRDRIENIQEGNSIEGIIAGKSYVDDIVYLKKDEVFVNNGDFIYKYDSLGGTNAIVGGTNGITLLDFYGDENGINILYELEGIRKIVNADINSYSDILLMNEVLINNNITSFVPFMGGMYFVVQNGGLYLYNGGVYNVLVETNVASIKNIQVDVGLLFLGVDGFLYEYNANLSSIRKILNTTGITAYTIHEGKLYYAKGLELYSRDYEDITGLGESFGDMSEFSATTYTIQDLQPSYSPYEMYILFRDNTGSLDIRKIDINGFMNSWLDSLSGIGKLSNFTSISELFQRKLISGVNIKTINGQTLLESGDIIIEGASSTSYIITEAGLNNEGFATSGNVYQYTIDNSRVNFGGTILSNGNNNIYVGSGETKTGLVQSDGNDNITSKPGLSFTQLEGYMNTTSYWGASFINGGTQVVELTQTEIRTYNLAGGAYNFDSGYTDGPMLDISLLGLMTGYGIFFKPDGTKMYIYGIINDIEVGAIGQFYEYTLSTANDISTATITNIIGITGVDYRFTISNDGNYIYTLGRGSGDIRVHRLDTAWDLSTLEQDDYIYNISNLGITPFSLYRENANVGYFLGSGNNNTIKILRFFTTDYNLRNSIMQSVGNPLIQSMSTPILCGNNGQILLMLGDFYQIGTGEIRQYQYTELFDGTSLNLII